MEYNAVTLANAIAKLVDKDGNLTPHFRAYLQCEHTYNSKVTARDRAHSAALANPLQQQQWPIEGASYQREVDAAWDRWIGLGFKLEIEQAISVLSAQGASSASALIARAKQQFQESLR